MRVLGLVSVYLLLSFTCGQGFAADNTHAAQAVKDGVTASGKASTSAAHSIVASGQVTSAVAAVPLSVGGAVSTGAARSSMKAATAPIGTPLEVTDESITTMPPNEALKRKDDKKSDKKI